MTPSAPTHPPASPQPAPPKLKPLPFAFPFLRKGQSTASSQFTDEHDIYRLLATSEASGSYLVSRKGMWHGGIHITEAGAGQALDLDAGLRCIADGVLVAWRANRDYPVSELAADGGNAPFQAPYSTGFALVRHEMEFPRGTKLTFYSLYMHLMSSADYDSNFPKRQKPAYWSRQWTITNYAQDKPTPVAGQVADGQVGLHVRRTPNGPVLGILPQGASVSIGKTETVHGATWGQLTDLNGATLYAPVAGGYVAPAAAITGWIFLGAQNGGPVAKETMPDSTFDRVVVTTNQACSPGDLQGTGGGIPVKAGDLMGHPGRYDSLDRCTAGTRMAHIEVFCDGSIKPFIKAGRNWVNANCANVKQWSQLGLSADPTILRIDRGTTLYDRDPSGSTPPQKSDHAKQTDVIQAYPFAALPQDAAHLFTETAPGSDGAKRRWWKADSADRQRNPISGWVREQNFAGGRVTREFSQDWIDFECHDEDHDPAHTIFATTNDYVDYTLGSDTPGAGSLGKLSPLMAAIYRVLYPGGDGAQAADELCALGQNTPGAGFPWAAFRASRLIAKHESEWANPAKWQELVSAIEQHTGPKPEHEEEKKRIAKLAWWDEVQAGVAGFPGPDVYHINPVGLVGNFSASGSLKCTHCGIDLSITSRLLKEIFANISDANAEYFSKAVTVAFGKYKIDSCNRAAHFLGQCEVECAGFTAFRENLNYTNGDHLWSTYRTALTNGLRRMHPMWTSAQMETYAKTHLIYNDSELGEVLFGDDECPGRDYRGRGLLHMTWLATYKKYKRASGIDVVSDPNKVQNDPAVASDSSAWFWSSHSINTPADVNNVHGVTHVINPALKDFARRKAAAQRAFAALNKGNQPCKQDWDSTLTTGNGW
ncbi:glycoside hydrolase family 19 protein [Paraburkholderia sp. J12]|uniref:glycoside hydrolase family 19 protein n=1 Tax=Paraburkholderia sp. J12 TaxID=2805432 RepID=UPI002ABE1CA1|nr:glycoside hydrolase family 19 protein [Paraburkholderia sp. J12]